jgi:O-methyltransferase involved in polyketide biosynthesis
MEISQVSGTAVLLLICRAVEAEKDKIRFNDPMAILCLDRLLTIASEEDKRWILAKKRMYTGLHERDAKAGVRKGKVFDTLANRFIADNPGCTVVDLACGFDTRYWRIENNQCKYIDVDLPEVITLKQELLKDHLDYELMGCSVLDTSWMDGITSNGNTGFLLLADGLFMWLLEKDATRLLQEIALRFDHSQLIIEMVPEKYTKGLWQRFLRFHSKLEWGLDVAWVFGIKKPEDLEVYGNRLKVIGVERGAVGPIITVSINATK